MYLTGLIRQALPSPGRDRLLAAVDARDCSWVPVPEGYLELGPAQMVRLEDRVIAPFKALPRVSFAVADAA